MDDEPTMHGWYVEYTPRNGDDNVVVTLLTHDGIEPADTLNREGRRFLRSDPEGFVEVFHREPGETQRRFVREIELINA